MNEPVFTSRHGLRYRWWRDFNWGLVVTVIVSLMIWGFAILLIGAWVFDWKVWW